MSKCFCEDEIKSQIFQGNCECALSDFAPFIGFKNGKNTHGGELL